MHGNKYDKQNINLKENIQKDKVAFIQNSYQTEHSMEVKHEYGEWTFGKKNYSGEYKDETRKKKYGREEWTKK